MNMKSSTTVHGACFVAPGSVCWPGQTVREEVMARRVGIVGIGIMGTAMMRNLVKDGFEVVGYDIAEVAMARLVESGGIAAASPRDVAEKTEILITSLPNVDTFEQVMT